MELEKIVMCAFEKIIQKYDLQTTLVSANEICTLENKWDELLSGGKKWMTEYQNFILYIPPRNVTKLMKKIMSDSLYLLFIRDEINC